MQFNKNQEKPNETLWTLPGTYSLTNQPSFQANESTIFLFFFIYYKLFIAVFDDLRTDEERRS